MVNVWYRASVSGGGDEISTLLIQREEMQVRNEFDSTIVIIGILSTLNCFILTGMSPILL